MSTLSVIGLKTEYEKCQVKKKKKKKMLEGKHREHKCYIACDVNEK